MLIGDSGSGTSYYIDEHAGMISNSWIPTTNPVWLGHLTIGFPNTTVVKLVTVPEHPALIGNVETHYYFTDEP